MACKNKVNPLGENDDRPMTTERWKEIWNEGKTWFHLPKVHPMLQKYLDNIVAKKQEAKVFLPLSGKSIDMKWLGEQGCYVIGNEIADLGCQQFFEENSISYKKDAIGAIPGTIYESTDEKYNIKLYCCDFFLLSRHILGDIDAIWDRGSLTAISVEDRIRYRNVISNVMGPNTKMLAALAHVDNEIFTGPPYDLSKQNVDDLFGNEFNVKLLEENDCLGDSEKKIGVKYFISQLFLLTRKS